MKSLFIPCIVIAGLILIFVVIDRKSFTRSNIIQTNHVGSIDSIESKNTETSPIAARSTSNSNRVPAVVPIVTKEEADKLNAIAVILATVKSSVVEGEILERSELPDPSESDYPNCRFTAHFNGNSIECGEPCPKEMSLIIDGFVNYTILDTNLLTPGDKVECTIVPFDKLPDEFKSTQQADDLNLFLLENYYAINIRKIQSFSDNAIMPRSGIFFSNGTDEYVSIFERRLNDSIPQQVKDAQTTSIRNDLEMMNRLLQEYDDEKINEINKRFNEVWNEEKKKDISGHNRTGAFVWRNIDNSFWCLPISYTFLSKPALLTSKTLDCFAALKEACEANNTQFIVSLVPNCFVISSRVINKDFRDVPDLQTATYVKQLSEIGVETIYSADSIIKNYNRYPFAFFFPGNAHPSDTAQDVNSEILANRLQRYSIEHDLDPALFSVKQSPHVYRDQDPYLFPKDCDIGDNKSGTPYTCREVLYDGKILPQTSNASIITLGNSYMQTPMNNPDSLPTLLSMKLLTPVDYLRVNASGPFTSIISQILITPERFLKHKKVLIMYFGTDALSDADTNSLMVNIREEDKNHLILDKKSVVMTYNDLKSVETDDSIDNSLWENLPQKHIQVLGESGILDIAKISIDSQTDTSKSVVCMIPAVCFRNQSASFLVNGIKKGIPSFYRNPFYSFISFQLSPGTKTIEISAEGKKRNSNRN